MASHRSPASVQAVFAAQAQARPDAAALLSGERTLSYGALDARADRLAARLAGLGVRAEEPVAVCSERSIEQLVALLAILKAGAAYLPLDPAWPDERLRFMLDDAGARVLLTSARRAPGGGVAHVLDLDEELVAAGPGEPPRVPGSPERLAYITYTSGSTGTPKGVPVEPEVYVM